MKIEPVVMSDGRLVEQATFEAGESLEMLGLNAEQSTAFWDACEQQWQAEFNPSPSRWTRFVSWMTRFGR